jgi:hypothetical protein
MKCAHPHFLSGTIAGVGFPDNNGRPDYGTDHHDIVPEGVRRPASRALYPVTISGDAE